MRTLSATSRALLAAAAVVAAALVLGGAYFVGYVGEVQRDLQDPASLRRQAASEIAAVEKALGYAGFLKAYRNYRLIGDAKAPPKLGESVSDAARSLRALRRFYTDNDAAKDPLDEAGAVVETFAHIARIAPQLGDAALRGTAAMEALNSLPQSPQLEATYLSLVGALDRLRQIERERQLGGAARALNASQALIIAAIGVLVVGLLVAAGLLQLGIIQPLKSLEHSLASVGDGALTHKIWGADRKDEFGDLARAGEKVRRGLAETSALEAMADGGNLHLTLDGKSSVLFEKLTADVASATDALKSATADLARLQHESRRQFEATVSKLGDSGAAFADAAKAARDESTATIGDLRTSVARLDEAATSRMGRLDAIAHRLEQTGRALEHAATSAKEKTDDATEKLSASNASFERVVADARLIQTAFFSACDKISSDAAGMSGKVQTLAARLADTVGALDARLAAKLDALDRLEQVLAQSLASLRHSADGHAGAHATHPPDAANLAKALRDQGEAIRAEIRDLAVRLTEDRLLAGAGTSLPAAKSEKQIRGPSARTLADVPGDEILARLKNLAGEMTAAQIRLDQVASLKNALRAFAAEVRKLGASGERVAKPNMGAALARHADEIEAHIGAVDPSAGAVRQELAAITGELRTIAAQAAATTVVAGPPLHEAAIRLADRAQKQFERLERAPDDAANDDAAEESVPAAAADDIAAMAQLIGRLESRTEHMAKTALAARFAEIGETMSPAERQTDGQRREADADGAIRTVFETIERLNNIAAALARAQDAERQRRVAH